MEVLTVEERAVAIAAKNGRVKPIKADLDIAKMEHIHATKMAHSGPDKAGAKTASLVLEGVQVDTRVVFRTYEELIENQNNHIFDECKTEEYLQDLERDIRENGIRTPLHIYPDNEISAGHTRRKIQKKLFDETGEERFSQYPCLIIRTELSRAERDRQASLDNLSRFDLTKAVRIAISAQLWPEFFKTGSVQAVNSGKKIQELAEEIAITQNTTPRNVFRDREAFQIGEELASQDGRADVTPADIKAGLSLKNEERKIKEKNKRLVSVPEPRASENNIPIEDEGNLARQLFDASNELQSTIIGSINRDIEAYLSVPDNEIIQAELGGYLKGIRRLIEYIEGPDKEALGQIINNVEK